MTQIEKAIAQAKAAELAAARKAHLAQAKADHDAGAVVTTPAYAATYARFRAASDGTYQPAAPCEHSAAVGYNPNGCGYCS